MADSSILLKQFDGSNYSQYFPQNLPLDIANQFVNSGGKNSNDIFNYLRKYCQYWWRKYFEGQVIEYTEQRTSLEQYVPVYRNTSSGWQSPNDTFDISYSKKININNNSGEVTLSNPQTKSLRSWEVPKAWTTEMDDLLKDFLNQNIPCYCTFKGGNTVYYLTESNSLSAYSDETDNYYSYDIDLAKGSIVSSSSKTYNKTETQYVNSINQSQYPDGEKVDKWLYTYLGIPLENTIENTQFACGTYVGTGASGSSSPNALQFSFSPKIIFIIGDNNNAGFGIYNGSIYSLYDTSGLSETTWNNKSISWFTEDSYSNSVRPEIQFNVSGRNYYYLALG